MRLLSWLLPRWTIWADGASDGHASRPARPEPAESLELDADDLLPISQAELKETLQQLIRTGGIGFLRADRGAIPPADDERTRLVNRALVTNGLLTADQVGEIQKVGAEMHRLREAMRAVQLEADEGADAAVEADKQAKAELKARKKAEAAARRQARADAIAHRKATDIIFLGRGVSGRLHLRESDTARLEAAGLPVLATPAELATALGLSVPRLRWLAFHTDVATRTHYVRFEVPKKSGGKRVLSAPHRTLKAAQQWLFREVVSRLPVESPAHGFVPARGIVTNAAEHVGRAVVVNLDLEEFFPSITFPRVRSVFHRAGYSPAVATVMSLLCTECPRQPVTYGGVLYWVATGPRGLPQGACTSPGLSNQVARRLDKRLGGLARKLGATYTRYADDLTFSGGAELNERVGYLMARVRHLAAEEGFAVNEKKSRVLRRNAAQQVTGLVVNDRPAVPRKEVRRLRAILHAARRDGLDAQNRTGHPDFRAWLLGRIAFVNMVRPDVAAKLLSAYRAVVGGPPR
jgi:hypothetical protein